MITGSSAHVEGRPSTAQRVRLIVFRVLATLAGLFFLVAVVLSASARRFRVAAWRGVEHRTPA